MIYPLPSNGSSNPINTSARICGCRGGGGGDDFWGEIELPELVNGTWWSYSVDVAVLSPEIEIPAQQSFTACL
ncbi:hypothetical protein TSUD_360980 [Trifolium subterraneum]|uniref:Uncharacterized protein n=1 Tax=Trifolium subterraneum TaxID=3900 RepID=A0A2Z6N5T7_TRISU|nr:hypothetical protein TSUD_360980 [Trifolium subterraneum]